MLEVKLIGHTNPNYYFTTNCPITQNLISKLNLNYYFITNYQLTQMLPNKPDGRILGVA
jgi:hypothetical protein